MMLVSVFFYIFKVFNTYQNANWGKEDYTPYTDGRITIGRKLAYAVQWSVPST